MVPAGDSSPPADAAHCLEAPLPSLLPGAASLLHPVGRAGHPSLPAAAALPMCIFPSNRSHSPGLLAASFWGHITAGHWGATFSVGMVWSSTVAFAFVLRCHSLLLGLLLCRPQMLSCPSLLPGFAAGY
ncbi:hypothetical protein AAFF_G00351170 [Aldrovandia affinis]|uniref:Uncharacterized protein n=1 Tax=Aldrovandia affinis TaxID=143900 RepID=A0AAD7SJ66_9TELE|nr:hypothetical protein AAFF_G00351170 [Aldrovandia affinis]